MSDEVRPARGSFRRRIIVAAAVVAAVTVAGATVLIVTMERSRAELSRATAAFVEEQAIADGIGQAVTRQLVTASAGVLGDADVRREFARAGERTYAEIQRYLFRDLSLEARLQLERVKEEHRRMEVSASRALELGERGREAEARAARAEMVSHAFALLGEMEAFLGIREAELRQIEGRQSRVFRLAYAVGGGLALLLLAGSGALAGYVYRSATGPLDELAAAARRIGGGDLDVRVEEPGTEEFAAVARGFNRMAAGLRRTGRALEDRNAELREALDWQEAVVEGSRDAIFVCDEAARLVLVNRAACELTGYSRGELMTMGVEDVRQEEDPEALRERFRRILGGEAVVAEAPIVRKDGTTVPAELNNRRIDVEGRRYVHTVARDITERREAERERRRTLALLEALFESVPGGILVEDAGRRVARVNSAFRDLFDLEARARELVGADSREAADDLKAVFEDPGAFVEGIEGRIAAGEAVHDEELETADGRTLERDYIPIPGEDGEVTGHLWHYRDVTGRKDRERRLRRAQRLESLGELTGGIAHDFNNLLTVIGANAELLTGHVDGGGEGSEPEELLSELAGSVDSATTLVRKLLTFGRQTPLDRRPVELSDVVRGEIRTLRRLTRDDVAIVPDLSDDLPPVRADPGSVQQMLINLVLNAQDAMPSGGEVRIAADACRLRESDAARREHARAGRWVRLAVSDDGAGMDAEVRRRIFEPFFTTKDRAKGTGLGLAVVYGLVRDHDGWIEVESAPGEGTSVGIHFPLAEAPLTDGRGRAGDGGIVRGDGETVLLVEDDAAVRNTCQRTLEKLGYRTVVAAEAEAALELWEGRGEEVDLVLTDWMMPGISGLELIDRLRAEKPGLRCILASGHPPEGQELDVEALDGVWYVQKPWTVTDLARSVRTALEG